MPPSPGLKALGLCVQPTQPEPAAAPVAVKEVRCRYCGTHFWPSVVPSIAY